jgi:hypothetical protein
VTAATETQVREAWDALADHSFTCPECRAASRRQDSSDCPAEWELYRVWKRLWVEAGQPLGVPTEVSR